jgi:hypothetical protein
MFNTTIAGVALIALGTCAALVPVAVGSALQHRTLAKRQSATATMARTDAPQTNSDLVKAA